MKRSILLLTAVLGLSGCVVVPYDGPVHYRSVTTTVYPAPAAPMHVMPAPVYVAPPPVVIGPPIHFGFGLHYHRGYGRGPYHGHGRRW